MNSLSMPAALAQHAGTDVGHAGELEQSLDGAVLAVRAVQDGEDDVDGGQELTGAVVQRQQLTATARVGSQGQRRTRRVATLGSWPSVMASVSGRASVEHPGALGGDADGTTSYRSGSRFRRTLPAETQEMACSELRPP